MNSELVMALNLIEKEKGIPVDTMIEVLETAIISAYKRNFASSQNVRVVVDKESGNMEVYAQKTVVEEVINPQMEILVSEAKEINPVYEPGDIYEEIVTPKGFGRIAAQTAKQVVLQRIREVERSMIIDEFSSKSNNIIIGVIQRIDRGNIFLESGKAELFLPANEQVPGESYRFHDRLKVFVTDVKSATKGPQITVSRAHSGLVKRMFETEVPEIANGVVEIMSISREAGSRTKIAVRSNDPNVDPLGSCVGAKGSRVQSIVDELRGEKIDIIKYNDDPNEYIAASLSPSKTVSVDADPEQKTAVVVVPDNQLSLAIGKEGQNARLAARLTGYKIDIKSESKSIADA